MLEKSKLLSSESLTLLPHAAWLGICVTLFILFVVSGVILKKTSAGEHKSPFKTILLFLTDTLKQPLLLFIYGYGFYVASVTAVTYIPHLTENLTTVILNAGVIVNKVCEFIAYFWAVLNVLNKGQLKLQAWCIKNNKSTLRILLPMISTSLKAAIVILILNILIPALGFTPEVDEIIAKTAKVILIGILAWVVVELMDGVEHLILNQYSPDNPNTLHKRKINTQVLLLKRVLLFILGIVTIASMLMVFDSVKNLGTGLLTTAGLISAFGAFASQQSLGRIFAGLQIAFTQPFSIGDTVIIDSEQGQVEEITLSYIVVKLWDLRRMIVPSDYFTNRGLQNLSRTSTELLGTIFFYVDYSLPLEPVRNYFNDILKNSALWDGKLSVFQVTEIKESSMELRALVSAKDASTLWDLRCEVREKIITFITKNYPQYLSKTRGISWKNNVDAAENA